MNSRSPSSSCTAKVHGLTLATRNTADFEACGIELVNPWEWQS
jgi:toxin FitB